MEAPKFSLSFSKRIEKKALQPSALGRDGAREVKAAPQVLLAVDQHSLQVNENVEEEQLVIPLLEAKRSAVLSRLAKLMQEDDGKTEEEEEEASVETEEDTKPLTLEEKAERALLEETKQKLGQWSTRDIKKDITIPAAATEDPLAAPLVDIGKESSLDDYEEIAVESFGAAVLRGMGWKKSEGIGGRGKRVVEIINPSSKTLGSTEGREGLKKEGEEAGEEEEDLPVVKGAFVFLHSGRHLGTYGVVEVVDEDHVLVKAAVGQAVLREVEANLKVVTQKEYRESSRVINKEMYDKFKEAETKKKEEGKKRGQREKEEEGSGSERDRKTKNRDRDRETAHRLTSGRDKQGSDEEQNRKQRDRDSERQRDGREERPRDNERQRDRDSERQRDRDSDRQRDGREERPRDNDKHRERDNERHRDKRQREQDEEGEQRRREKEAKRYKEERKDKYRDLKESNGRSHKKKQEEFETQKMKVKQKMMVPPWVRENLRVRIISKTYKGGKYHKEKVVVVSVVTAESCECVAENGRLLGSVDPAWLETVIPKQQPMVVMVVRGQHSGQKGRILQLHKDQEKASIQLLEDETTILKLHYDDICEYVLR